LYSAVRGQSKGRCALVQKVLAVLLLFKKMSFQPVILMYSVGVLH